MVQYGDESIKLSGITSIAPTVLDFTGTTTAETSVTITDLTGYLNGGRISGLKILPPELKQSGSTGTTTVNVENYVLKALDPYGSVGWSPISGISWSVSACTSPLNVTNIVPCTPGGTIYFNAGDLEINNTVRINDGSQVNGYVFTSDVSGNGSWLPPVDNYTTGATLNGTIIEFNRTDLSNAYNVDIKPALLDYLPLRITGNTVVSVADNVDLYFSGFTGSSIINYVNYGNSLEYINGTVISKDYATLFNRRLTNLETFSIYAISSKGIALDYSDSGGTVNEFYVNKSAMLANSTIPTFQGIKYGSDYSPNYSNRSLVDKEYVDNLVSSTIFTGNTSASCITDLYVTNVHGCSPITFWDSLQTIGSSANGLSSIALGISNTADGVSSSAFGGGTLALGSASFAEGYQTLALGDSTHAEGYQTIAGYRALTATSIVSGVVTIGDNVDYSAEFTSGTVLLNNQFYTYTGTSYSAPNFFINLSNNSVIIPLVSVNVVDYNNYNSPLAYISVGDNAHSEGLSTVALGAASHAEGMTTQAIGDISHAEGYQTLSYGVYSHAEGYGSVSYGQYSHAQNNFTTAFGSDSHSEGQGTTAYGNFSHAQGSGTFAIGEGSHAEGYYTNAYGNFSHAGGSGSTVSGETSFIHSVGSLLTGNRSVLLGGLNLTGTTDDTVYVPYLNIDNLGAGTSINNLGIDSNGNVVVGTSGGGGGVSIDPYEFYVTGPSITLNISGKSTNYDITITANTTLDLINVRDGEYGTVIVNQDIVGSRTATFGTVNGSATTHLVVNGGGGSPTLTATPLAVDILSFTYNGSKMFWTVGNDYT